MPVNAGAAGIDKLLWRRCGQPLNQIARPVKIDFPIFVNAAFGRGNRIYYPVKRSGQFGEVLRPGDVCGERLNTSRFEFGLGVRSSPEAENFVPLSDQFGSERQPDVTTADD